MPAVYGSDLGRPAFRRFHCSVAQAKRWLGHLAPDKSESFRANRPRRIDGERGNPALAWWELGSLAGRWRLLGMLLRAAVLWSVAAYLVVWVLTQHGNWHHGTYSGPLDIRDLLLSGPLGRLIRPTVDQLVRALPKETVRETQVIIADVFHAISYFLSHWYLLALAVSAAVLVAAWRLSVVTPDAPRRLQIRVTSVLWNALTSCGTLFVLALIGSFWLLHSTLQPGSANTFFNARSTWISLGVIALSRLTSVPSSFARPSDTSGNLSPQESLRLDRQADLVVTVSRRSASTAAAWLFAGQEVAVAYTAYATLATFVALTLGGVEGVASRTYVDARIWLATRGWLPWRTMAFLADASRRGVIRQVGATYQFRHVRLLEEADAWRSSPKPAVLDQWSARLASLMTWTRRRFLSRQEQEQKILREEAARCWRIANTKDDTLSPDFATTLDELISQLQPSRDERSLASLEDLLDAYRALADSDPGTYKPRIAEVLVESIHAFPQEKVLPAAEEAAAAYRELADADAVSSLPSFATAVHDQANRLARLGRVRRRREAHERSSRYLPSANLERHGHRPAHPR